MKPAWLGLLAGALLVWLVYWQLPYRFTPIGAIEASTSGKVSPVLSERFPGGQATLLFRTVDGCTELHIIRRWGPFYRAMVSSVLYPPLNGDLLSATFNRLDLPGRPDKVVAFGGMVTDPGVVKIAAGGLERSVQGSQRYLFVWVTTDPEIWRGARALDAAGQPRYELHGLQWAPTTP